MKTPPPIMWKVGRRTYTAPALWVAARQGAHVREGKSAPQAYRAALLDWETQEDLMTGRDNGDDAA